MKLFKSLYPVKLFLTTFIAFVAWGVFSFIIVRSLPLYVGYIFVVIALLAIVGTWFYYRKKWNGDLLLQSQTIATVFLLVLHLLVLTGYSPYLEVKKEYTSLWMTKPQNSIDDIKKSIQAISDQQGCDSGYKLLGWTDNYEFYYQNYCNPVETFVFKAGKDTQPKKIAGEIPKELMSGKCREVGELEYFNQAMIVANHSYSYSYSRDCKYIVMYADKYEAPADLFLIETKK